MAAHSAFEFVTIKHAVVCAVNFFAVVVTIATVVIAVIHETLMRGYVAPLRMVPWCKSHTIARKEAHSLVLLVFDGLHTTSHSNQARTSVLTDR